MPNPMKINQRTPVVKVEGADPTGAVGVITTGVGLRLAVEVGGAGVCVDVLTAGAGVGVAVTGGVTCSNNF